MKEKTRKASPPAGGGGEVLVYCLIREGIYRYCMCHSDHARGSDFTFYHHGGGDMTTGATEHT